MNTAIFITQMLVMFGIIAFMVVIYREFRILNDKFNDLNGKCNDLDSLLTNTSSMIDRFENNLGLVDLEDYLPPIS